MIRVAICDDHPKKTAQFENLLQQIWTRDFSKHNHQLSIELFFSGSSLINSLENNYFDLILLDIQMGSVSGIDAATYLRDSLGNSDSHIIYISAYDSYLLTLFDTTPSGFIKKPIDPAEFNEKVAKILNRILQDKSDSKKRILQIVTKSELYQIDVKHILYLESKARKINVLATNREDLITFYGQLNDYQTRSSLQDFIRIHQSYLVNLRHIISVRQNELTCSNMDILPISSRYKKTTHHKYLTYRGGIYD